MVQWRTNFESNHIKTKLPWADIFNISTQGKRQLLKTASHQKRPTRTWTERNRISYVVVSLSILSVFIVVSNFCVCLLVYLKKTLRTNTNWLMVSLAVSDILTGGVLLPVYLIEPYSVVTGYLVCLILLWGVANLCAVTYDRYIAIIKPLEYSYRAPKILKRSLILSWLLPAIYSLLPLFWNTNQAPHNS